MTIEVFNECGEFPSGVKRFRVPIIVTSTCPQCGEEVDRDLGGDLYLSYPFWNKPFKLTFAHEKCVGSRPNHTWEHHEWEHTVLLRATLQLAPPEGAVPDYEGTQRMREGLEALEEVLRVSYKHPASGEEEAAKGGKAIGWLMKKMWEATVGLEGIVYLQKKLHAAISQSSMNHSAESFVKTVFEKYAILHPLGGKPVTKEELLTVLKEECRQQQEDEQ